MLLANGGADLPAVLPGTSGASAFEEALRVLTAHLSREIVRDGEGATTVVRLDVVGARDALQAELVARAVCNSPLVKTAIHGRDPNWGRILCAAGYAGVDFDPAKTDVWLQGVRVCRKGLAAEYDEAALSKKLDLPNCAIRLQLGEKGPGAATFWTCDLTHDYITINASYRT